MFQELELMLPERSHDGPMQMALDEVLLRSARKPLLRIYRWDGPCVSFGYFQKQEIVKQIHPILPSVRRWTGGGIVEHGEDHTFSLILPKGEAVARLSPVDFYRQLHGCLAGWVSVPMPWSGQYPFGFGADPENPSRIDWQEPLKFLALLRSLGIRLVCLSCGSPYYNPHLQRPAATPPSDGYLPPEDPLAGVIRQLESVEHAKAAFPELLFVGSGYSYLQDWLPHVGQAQVEAGAVDFIGLGRMILSYPDLPGDVLAGQPLQRRKICRTFSECTTGPRNGLVSGCFPLDEFYKTHPAAEALKAQKRAAASS